MRKLSTVVFFLVSAFWSFTVCAQQNALVFTAIEGSVNSDISMTVLREAYAELGIDVTMRPLPAERAIRTSNSGDADGEVFRIANINKKYPNLIAVPTAINVLQAIAFSKHHKFTIDGWQSIKDYKIGIQVGIKFAERGTTGMNPVTVGTNKQLFMMLDSDRVEIAVAAQANGLKTLKETGIKSVYALTPPIQEYPLYHYLHKKNADLIPRLDKIIQKMRDNGRLAEIRKAALDKLRH